MSSADLQSSAKQSVPDPHAFTRFYGWAKCVRLTSRRAMGEVTLPAIADRVCTESKERIDRFATENKTEKRMMNREERNKPSENMFLFRSAQSIHTAFNTFTSFCTPSLFMLHHIALQITKSYCYKLPSIYVCAGSPIQK